MILQGKVTASGLNGDGLVTIDDEKYYVPFTVPGDEVEFEFIKQKKFQRLDLLEVKSPGPERQAAPCPHFGVCGGCKLQHFSDSFYQEFKLGLLHRALDFHQVEALEWRPLKIIPTRRRRRISLTFAHRNEGLMLGYMRRNSKQIVDVQECHLVVQEIEDILPPLRKVLAQLFTRRESGHLDILLSREGLDVNLKNGYIKKLDVEQTELLTNFAASHNLARLLLNYRPVVTFREPMVTFSGVDVAVEAGKFLQASDDADEFMLATVASYMPQTITKAVDLFSGRGTFTFLLAERAPTDAYECEQDALTALADGAKRSGRPVNVIKRDLFADPLTVAELNACDFIMVDPPRAGALAQVQEIAQSSLQHVVYVSCNPASFARDAQVLCQAGFKLTSVTPLDQFLWSEHLEVIGKFER